MKKELWKKVARNSVAIGTGLLMVLSSNCLATSIATDDVTPPWGRIKIQGATEVNSTNYVDRKDIIVEIYANDDTLPDANGNTGIEYYISTSEISDQEILTTGWKEYKEGATEEIELPNTTSTNTIYAVFRDAAGNTTLIYNGTNTQYEVQYDANVPAGETVEMPTGMATTGTFGMPFTVTMQTPKREGYYFWGWSTIKDATSPNCLAGDILPASVFSGTDKTIPLYAVWTTTINDLPSLASVVKTGDYVNYPVYYDNVYTYNENYKSTYNGWRVISKDVDLEDNISTGTVNLISAGVPLTYECWSFGANNAATELRNTFLDIPFSATDDGAFKKTGFSPYITLKETFRNKFTAMKADGVTPAVRSIIPEDIYRITGETSLKTGSTMDLINAKYEKLFDNGGYYWLALVGNNRRLWYVDYNGRVYDNVISSDTAGLRPVVSLKPEVKVTGTDMIGAWNIIIAD